MQGTWGSHTRKRSEAGCGRPEDGGVGTAKTVQRPPQQPAQPQYANYWAPLTRKRHTLPQPAQPQHTNHWASRMRKRHQQEHRPQRPTERSDPTQHAKGRTGDCPGPRKETTTRRNVTQRVPPPVQCIPGDGACGPEGWGRSGGESRFGPGLRPPPLVQGRSDGVVTPAGTPALPTTMCSLFASRQARRSAE